MLDKQEELNEAFKNFAEKMAEDNASTFIKALEKAMQEFNDNLTKTVGANFVRLNEGIENMLVWQDKYKDQIETSNLQLNTIKTSLDVSEKNVSQVIKHAKSFSDTSDKLDNTLKSLYDTQVRIEGGMLSFDKVSKDAKENFSMVSKGFDVLKKSFTEVVDSTIKANNDNLTKVIASITTHKEKIDKELVSLYSVTSKKIDDTVDSATTKTSGMVTKNIKDVLDFNQQSNIELKNAMINIQKEMSERITAFKAQMQKMGEDINKTLADNVSTMDTATKSTINNLGKSLTSIAEYMSDKLDKK
jgi:alkylhydroperoxidase/carboxymuconolactone decarboxylase family protein YurZ